MASTGVPIPVGLAVMIPMALMTMKVFNSMDAMKKIIYRIGMLAVAALTFLACKQTPEGELPKEEATHVATVVLGKNIETKTMVVEGDNGASYKWNNTDAQYLKVYENGTLGEITGFSLNQDRTVATLTVSFTGTPTAPYTYTAKYAETVGNKSPHNPQIPAEQSPLNGTFDPAADVLVSKEITSTSARLSDLSFTMGRPATVNKMTLTGLTAGEVISKVEFTLNKAFVGGYVSYNSDNNEYQPNSAVSKLTLNYDSTTGVVPTGGQFPVFFVCAPVEDAPIVSVVVTTDQNVYTKAGNAASTDPFYHKTISFAIGTMKRFTMAMSGYGEPIGNAVDYTLVESTDKIAAGAEYIFVSTKSNNDLCAASSYGTGTNYYYTTTDVTASNKVISIDAQPAMVFTFENGATSGQYYIVDGDGKYLYWDSGNTVKHGDKDDTNAYLWTISLTDGICNVATPARKLQYNSGSPRFACYATNQKSISLYVNESTLISTLATPQNLIATDVGSGIVNVSWDVVTGADSYTVTLGETSQTGVTANSTSFNSVADGTYTVTVIAISNDHTVANDSQAASTTVKVGTPALGKPVISSFTETDTGFSAEIDEEIQYATSYDWTLYEGSVNDNNVHGMGNTTSLSFSVPFTSSDVDIDAFTPGTTYYLVVTSKADGYASTDSDAASFVAETPSYDFENIATLNGLTATAGTYSGYLTSAIVSFVNGKTAIIKDATGSALVYKDSHGLLQGQTYTGKVNVTSSIYQGNAQITAIDAIFTGSETTVAPESVALSALAGHYSDYQNAYVSVAGLTVVSVSSRNINVTDGTNNYVVYDNPGAATCGAGDIITAVGTITKYNTTEEIKVWSASDIAVTGIAPKAITFSQPASGGSFTVTAGGNTINSGDTVASETTVTLTATNANGYTFSGWTVTGATVANASAATTTFTMGTSAVTVSASFTNNNGGSYTITFGTGSGDGSTASTSTACSTIVSAGSSYLSGNLATATKVYYNGSNGLKLGASSAAGIVKMNLANSVTPTSIVVRAKLYNSSKSATLKVNGSATQSVTANFSDLTFNITSEISYLQLESSKYIWIESITVNY